MEKTRHVILAEVRARNDAAVQSFTDALVKEAMAASQKYGYLAYTVHYVCALLRRISGGGAPSIAEWRDVAWSAYRAHGTARCRDHEPAKAIAWHLFMASHDLCDPLDHLPLDDGFSRAYRQKLTRTRAYYARKRTP